MNYSFHDEAEKELEEIEKYYDDIRDELGDRFRDEIQLAISRILKRPQAWQPMTRSTRRCRLNSFPYGLLQKIVVDNPHYVASDVQLYSQAVGALKASARQGNMGSLIIQQRGCVRNCNCKDQYRVMSRKVLNQFFVP